MMMIKNLKEWLSRKFNFWIIAYYLKNRDPESDSDRIVRRALQKGKLDELEQNIELMRTRAEFIELKKERQKRWDYLEGQVTALDELIEQLQEKRDLLSIEADILKEKVEKFYQGK